MALESFTFIDGLVATNPVGATDPKSEGDDHLRGIKTVLKATFPGMTGRAWRAQSKGSTYTLVAGDNMSIIKATAAITLDLTAVATLGNGFMAIVDAKGGNVTVDPNLTEVLNNGLLTFVIPRGCRAMLVCDGSEWSCDLLDEPPGTMKDYGGTTAPGGYLGCDGSAVSRTTYAALFNAIGTTWGVGDGSTTFNVPNFQRRVAVGSGGSGTGTLGNAVGNTGGAETHTLSEAEMPSHTHGAPQGLSGAGGFGIPGGASGLSSLTGPTGGGGSHNNMQPSAVVMKIIKT